jgi:glutaredoxin
MDSALVRRVFAAYHAAARTVKEAPMRSVFFALSALLALIFACSKSGPAEGAGPDAAAAIPEIRVHPDNSGLAFRFIDRASGEFATVGSIDDVPEEVRPAVMVVDTNADPAPPQILYVADLTNANDDGSYPYKTIDRYEYERGVRTTAVASGSAAAGVTLYSTEWCGACKMARSWLQQNKVAFVERDLEKDAKALPALREAAGKAGMDPKSVGGQVPVVVVGDKVMLGFDPNKVQAALGR